MALQLNISIGHGRVATFGVLPTQQLLDWQGRLTGVTAGTGRCTNECVSGYVCCMACMCMACMRTARTGMCSWICVYACVSPGNIPSTSRQGPQVFTLDTKSLGVLWVCPAFLLTIVDGGREETDISYLFIHI